MELKYCPICKQNKPLTEFGIIHKNKDGHRKHCRLCHNQMRRQQRLSNLEYYREHASQYQRRYGLTPQGRYNKLKSNCQQSKMPLNISADAFVSWYSEQPKTCYYCQMKLVNGGARSGQTTLTIDRKDNRQGYTLVDITLCCRRCNLMKGDWLTERQMLEIAKQYFKS